MKKIPTLFVRTYENNAIVGITDSVTDGCTNAFLNGEAKVKYDGSCCAIIEGEFYKRYDAKHGKQAPEGAIPCCEPDPITGHHPHWVKVDQNDSSNKWFVEALRNTKGNLTDGTYEAIGVHFQRNPYGLTEDSLVKHEEVPSVFVERSFEGIYKWLSEHEEEGLVFWLNGEPICKIKRSDFGLTWNPSKPLRNDKKHKRPIDRD